MSDENQRKSKQSYLPNVESNEQTDSNTSNLKLPNRQSNISKCTSIREEVISKQQWNDSIENVVKSIGEKCKLYKQMHIHYAQQSTLKFKRISILSIIVGPISGILTTIEAATNDHISILLISSVLSFISGAISAIIKFAKYEEVITAHKSAAAKYTSLETNVRRQLALYRNDRINVELYLNWLNESFDSLYMSCPLIPKQIYDLYGNQDENGIIFVNKEFEDQKCKEITDTTEIPITDQKKVNLNSDIVINIDSVMKKSKTIYDRDSPTSNSTSDSDYDNNRRPSTFSSDSSQNAKGNNAVKRTNTMSHYHDFNRYNSDMMNYEMKRFFGFSA